MKNEIIAKTKVIPATLDDYPIVRNMAQLYIYDASRGCGFSLNKQGLYQYRDYKEYFENSDRAAYIVKVENELAGFVLLNKVCAYAESEWNVGEFFILSKFQGQGVGKEVAKKVWQLHPGKWEVPVVPQNRSALVFWRSIISNVTNNQYKEEMKDVERGQDQVQRVIFSFAVL
ncbi:MAG: acetyltransferase, GNAT family [uncultured bacterium]|nr:MAG: acetyltransferase, GNAT family [uncultured bacterium]OFW69958.1 MAG: hypothetical protein A2X70_00090 [Alphaproteobacteria bacterium GWC2_42_16]OFW74437.1 MAG: hypothetical protein A2Z80_05355 [Alphaproteobacteria bacterium GWA2_41_27]OFW84790.1 MAG: hypothetical protein A3E50_00815 [Alphaproteobacteria bacterium RIFCSPHIGHO2_12_FULL_42_100]OFW90665.1 MAG: hypothetical protein A3C41_04625 [Alphaproteobacteria bacterium RIFCSPHIGHO2_02_FULL_42_30]OFW93481.1 MAG: hypothetical protein A2W